MKQNIIINIANLIYKFTNLKDNISSCLKKQWNTFCCVNTNVKSREYVIEKNFADIWLFKTFLKKRLSRNVISCNMLMVHSAAFLYKNNPFVFIGESGTGKSTLIKNVKNQTTVLSDDTNIIDVENLIVYSTPYGDDVPKITHISAPLRKIFVLNKLHENVVQQLHTKDAMSYILKTLLVDTTSRKLQMKIFELVIKLVKSVRFYLFSYKINSDLFTIFEKLSG